MCKYVCTCAYYHICMCTYVRTCHITYMYIFETIFATILLQTYLDRIKWSDSESSSLKIRSVALYILRSSRSLLLLSVSDIDTMLNNGRSTSSAVVGRRAYVKCPGIGMPVTVQSRSNLVGAVANGVKGIARLDGICSSATPNFVKHKSLKLWWKVGQLSSAISGMIEGGVDC